MNKTILTVSVVAVALITAGTIYAMKDKGVTPATTLASETSGRTARSNEARGDDRVVVPDGTTLHFKLTSGLYTKTSNLGDTFQATVASPVSVNGHVVVPE